MSDPTRTIFEKSTPGRRAAPPFELDVPRRPLDELLPEHLRRRRPAALPEVDERELIDHYTKLAGKPQ